MISLLIYLIAVALNSINCLINNQYTVCLLTTHYTILKKIQNWYILLNYGFGPKTKKLYVTKITCIEIK